MSETDLTEVYENYIELWTWVCVEDEELHGEPNNE